MKDDEIRTVAFFGKVTAGVTHELKNVLAIIRESAGLLEDILSMADDGSVPHRDKFDQALSTIGDQTERGGDLIAQLNKFAHSPDQPIATVDLYELTKQVVSLSQRFARLRKVSLNVSPPEQSLTINTRPVELQMAIFNCLECCLPHMPSGGQIDILLHEHGQAVSIRTSCGGDFPEGFDFSREVSLTQEWTVLQEGTAAIGGSVSVDNSAPIILLSVPMNA